MGIFEGMKEEIMQEIQREVESGQFTGIPEALTYIKQRPVLKNALLEQYTRDTMSMKGMCIDEDTAILQACLNDSVIIGANHELYTNSASSLLNVAEKYEVNMRLASRDNKRGKCRAYKLTKNKTTNMEKGIGLIRTQHKFQDEKYWIYPIIRIYIEFILLYAKTYGIKIEAEDYTRVFTFNDKIKERYHISLEEWDKLHKPIESLEEVFNTDKSLNDKNAGYIGVTTDKCGYERIDMLKVKEVTPVDMVEVARMFGGKVVNPIEAGAFKTALRDKNHEDRDSYIGYDLEIHEQDIEARSELKRYCKKITDKYKEWREVPFESLGQLLHYHKTVLIEYTNGDCEFLEYRKKAKPVNDEIIKDKRDLYQKKYTDEIQEMIADAETGGYNLFFRYSFLADDVIEGISLTTNEDKYISKYRIRRGWQVW